MRGGRREGEVGEEVGKVGGEGFEAWVTQTQSVRVNNSTIHTLPITDTHYMSTCNVYIITVD